jgi:hypothetical protein
MHVCNLAGTYMTLGRERKNRTGAQYIFIMVVGRTASLSLYRSLLREAKKVDNYNFRLYAIRRIKAGYRSNIQSNDNNKAENAELAYRDGIEQLNVLKRQSIVGNLYPSARSVMETSV